jgi:uncharacterized protein (TIGR03000 family)
VEREKEVSMTRFGIWTLGIAALAVTLLTVDTASAGILFNRGARYNNNGYYYSDGGYNNGGYNGGTRVGLFGRRNGGMYNNGYAYGGPMYNGYGYSGPGYGGYGYNGYGYNGPWTGGQGYYSGGAVMGSGYYGPYGYPRNISGYYNPNDLLSLPQGSGPAPCQVEIRVPPTAKVWFDGDATTQTGNMRLYSSPPIQTGKTFTYQVTAKWMDGDKEVAQTRTVEVRAGRTTVVDFTQPAPEK